MNSPSGKSRISIVYFFVARGYTILLMIHVLRTCESFCPFDRASEFVREFVLIWLVLLFHWPVLFLRELTFYHLWPMWYHHKVAKDWVLLLESHCYHLVSWSSRILNWKGKKKRHFIVDRCKDLTMMNSIKLVNYWELILI